MALIRFDLAYLSRILLLLLLHFFACFEVGARLVHFVLYSPKRPPCCVRNSIRNTVRHATKHSLPKKTRWLPTALYLSLPFPTPDPPYYSLSLLFPKHFQLSRSSQKLQKSSKMESKKPLRILCFGDSLTEGYTQYGLNFTPYSDTLLDKLRSNLSISTRYNISIDTDGMSGDQVTGGFLTRMKECCTYLPIPPFALFTLLPSTKSHT